MELSKLNELRHEADASRFEASKKVSETVMFLCDEVKKSREMKTPQMVAAIAELAKTI